MVCAQAPQVQSRLTESVHTTFTLSPSHGLFPTETPAGMPTRNKRFSSRNYSVPLEINNGKNITENTHTSKEGREAKTQIFYLCILLHLSISQLTYALKTFNPVF